MSQAATEGQEPNGAAGSTATGQEPGATGSTGQEPGNQAGATAASGADGQIDVEAITDPALKAFVISQQKAAKDARDDAAKHRTQAKELADWKAEQERANETAEQTAVREAAERETERQRLLDENRTLKVDGAVRSAAESAKAHDPETVLALIGSKVTLDDSGKPTNVADLLADLRQTKPFLFKRSGVNAGEGNGQEPDGGEGDMNAAIRRSAGRG
jgi:hypothetical protein